MVQVSFSKIESERNVCVPKQFISAFLQLEHTVVVSGFLGPQKEHK